MYMYPYPTLVLFVDGYSVVVDSVTKPTPGILLHGAARTVVEMMMANEGGNAHALL